MLILYNKQKVSVHSKSQIPLKLESKISAKDDKINTWLPKRETIRMLSTVKDGINLWIQINTNMTKITNNIILMSLPKKIKIKDKSLRNYTSCSLEIQNFIL